MGTAHQRLSDAHSAKLLSDRQVFHRGDAARHKDRKGRRFADVYLHKTHDLAGGFGDEHPIRLVGEQLQQVFPVAGRAVRVLKDVGQVLPVQRVHLVDDGQQRVQVAGGRLADGELHQISSMPSGYLDIASQPSWSIRIGFS